MKVEAGTTESASTTAIGLCVVGALLCGMPLDAGYISRGKRTWEWQMRMDLQLLLLCVLVGAIHLISTLSYGIRIAGVRTGRLAFSLALFNVLVLCSRSSNAILAPLLSKRVELSITDGSWTGPGDFRVLLLAASLATVFGAFLIPSCQRIVTAAVNRFESKPSMIALALAVAKPASWRFALGSITLPASANMSPIRFRGLPWGTFGMNVLGIAFISCGVFSSLCAGHLAPELRLTYSRQPFSSGELRGYASAVRFRRSALLLRE
ncbi:DUF2837 family protein [Candidatus Bathyarchaeota archaeon]|nr:DUF2837 family protein [Candidatus Bathyarchaeota archaeon]